MYTHCRLWSRLWFADLSCFSSADSNSLSCNGWIPLSLAGFFVLIISLPSLKDGMMWNKFWSKAISCRLFGYQFQVGTILSQWDLSWSLSPALSHRLPFQTRQGGLSIAPSTCDHSFWCGYLFQVGTSPSSLDLFRPFCTLWNPCTNFQPLLYYFDFTWRGCYTNSIFWPCLFGSKLSIQRLHNIKVSETWCQDLG